MERLERVHEDSSGEPIPWLYRRQYQTSDGGKASRFYAIFTDWDHNRRRFALGTRFEPALRKLADYRRKNDAEYDFDEGKARNVTISD